MRTLLAYIIVLPLSFFASRLAAIVIGGPIAFTLTRASARLRSTIAGFTGSVGGVAAAVTFGWGAFHWVVGPGSFTLVPFLASVLFLTVSIPKDLRHAQNCAQTQAELQASGQQEMANDIGNQWSTVAGDLCGLVLAVVWFFFPIR